MNKHIYYSIRDGVVERNIHGIFFLIDIKDNYLDDKCSLYELNEMGHVVWSSIPKYRDNQIQRIADDIEKMISDKVANEIIQNDVKGYLATLANKGFLIKDGRNK